MGNQGFTFGKNWQRFLRQINEATISNAEGSIKEFLRLKDLRGKTFLDIGCGSGLFSYVAWRLGAKRIVSFDVDPDAVECCKYFHKMAHYPNNWRIYNGSILDKDFLQDLGRFDIVYAWGTLHHTGDMWRAIKNSARMVGPDGYYYISIYNKVEGMFGSDFWLNVKKVYNSLNITGKYILEIGYMLYNIGINIRKNPLYIIKNYSDLHRGMEWRTDIRDWLGGHPYEFATPDEVIRYVTTNFPDFCLENIKTTNSLSPNEYLFRNTSQA